MNEMIGWAFPAAMAATVALIEVVDLIERRRARRRKERRAQLVAEGIAPPAPINIRRRARPTA